MPRKILGDSLATARYFDGGSSPAHRDLEGPDLLHIPSHVPHRAVALEDTLDLDIFSPIRTDWLTKDDSYLRRGEREKT